MRTYSQKQVAMYEHFASFGGGPPNQHHYNLYSTWANYDWAMVITGNVQVSSTHLTLGRDMVVPETLTEETLAPFRHLARCIHNSQTTAEQHSGACTTYPRHPTLAIMQLSHAGRQSSIVLGGRYLFEPPLAPSAVHMQPKDATLASRIVFDLAFPKPRAMTKEDINEVVEQFVRGAMVAYESGFDGVELHAAHGYLLAQFISPKTNHRTDDYSCSGTNALRLLHRICISIREKVPSKFVLGIKLNAGDYVQGAESSAVAEGEAIGHLREISTWGLIDFIEISGGDYEQPHFMTHSKSTRQALFSRFSKLALQTLHPSNTSQALPPSLVPSPSSHSISPDLAPSHGRGPPLILLTGGLRTPSILLSALSQNHTHLLGMGRPSVLSPDLPLLLKARLEAHGVTPDTGKEDTHLSRLDEPFRPEPQFTPYQPHNLPSFAIKKLFDLLPKIPLVGAGVEMTWYNVHMRRLAAEYASRKSSKAEAETEKMVIPMPDYGMGGLMAIVHFWLWVAPGDGTRILVLCVHIGKQFSWFLGYASRFLLGVSRPF
ncbi:hypothetical protein AX16_010545 [Volvariella volvacea WC 439]|nr:hypothetical protein AX16_010545 [Volvariella volvacea WC 439]